MKKIYDHDDDAANWYDDVLVVKLCKVINNIHILLE